MIPADTSISYQYVGKLNMLVKPMIFGSLSWETRCSVITKLMSCYEVNFFFFWVLGRGEEKTIISNSQNSRSFFFSEVQRKQSWFSGIGGNTINSSHAVQSASSDLSFHAPLTFLDYTLELSRKKKWFFKGIFEQFVPL